MQVGRPRALVIVLTTIALAVGLLASPAATLGGSNGPASAVDFIDAWTNDDGSVNDGDLGDTGVVSPAYDAWLLSSSDPSGLGIDPARYDKDVAVCTAGVRGDDPDFVDVTIENAYPGYHCTFTTILENGAAVPVEITPAVIDTDDGLLVQTSEPQFPGTLAGGDQAPAVFTVTVLQQAPQNDTLHFTITIDLATPPCEGSVVFGVERGTGDLYMIDPVAGTAWLLADITDPAPGNVNSPNGLAYDADNGRLYFSVNDTAGDDVTTSDLYFWNGTSVLYAGTVTGLPAGAELRDGAYFYFVNASDELRRVTFDPGGTIVSDTLFAADVTGNTESLRFGDLVIEGTTLYGSTNAPAENFFSITDLGGANTYTEISAPQGSRLQLALSDDGTLFGQSTPTGEFFTVDPLTGSTSSLGVPTGATDGMTDLASGVCPDDWPPDPSGPIPDGD